MINKINDITSLPQEQIEMKYNNKNPLREMQ